MTDRKQLWTLGGRPHTVSVYSEATPNGTYCRVQWRVRGARRTKSWPDTGAGRREAKAFANALQRALGEPERRPSPTLGALWSYYVDAEFETLREKTQRNYRAHWRAWELYAGRETLAESVTRESLDSFRKELRRLDIAISQIRKHVELVKRVYRFGVDRELLPPTRLLDYKIRVGKDEATSSTAEYRADDARKIIGVLDPEKSTEWRAWLFTTIAHYTGGRTNAILHLQWNDVDRIAPSFTWRGKWSKTGKEWTQPVPRQVVEALAVAEEWRTHDRYMGPWIFYTARRQWKGDRPMTYGAIGWMLRQAESRAGVAHVHMNLAHRFRRGLVGDVVQLTNGDVRLAMSFIGDGVKEAVRYVKDRDDRLRAVADLLSGPAPTATEQQSSSEETL